MARSPIAALGIVVALVAPLPALANEAKEGERTGVVVRTLLGLVALLALAYAGGHPRVRRWERRLGISQVVTAGFPFVALGLVARLPSVGILTDETLVDLGPLLRLGLGWIGFITGFRLDTRILERAPRGTATFVTARTAVAFLSIAAAASVAIFGVNGFTRETLTSAGFLRDAVILGSAGSLMSSSAAEILATRGDRPAAEFLSRVIKLEEIAGVVGLLAIAAYFRPHGAGVSWHLPGTAWLLLSLGAGVAFGAVTYASLLWGRGGSGESQLLVLGSIAFASGAASGLRISPVVVCFVAGVLVGNFPGHYKETVARTLSRLERPVYLLFLLVVGALWRVRDARGWALMGAFVAARVLGKWLGTVIGARRAAVPDGATRTLVVAPMGALSIAIVVNADTLYPDGAISWLVTAVVGGAIVTEMLFQLAGRAFGGASTTPLPASGGAPAGATAAPAESAAPGDAERPSSVPPPERSSDAGRRSGPPEAVAVDPPEEPAA